jgi:hypothetical protein
MGDVILWDQLLPTEVGVISQEFQAGLSDLNSQVSDNFLIPVDETWTINEVDVSGIYSEGSDPASSVNVSFYNTSLSDPTLPEEIAIVTLDNLPITSDVGGDFVIQLPEPGVTLPSGRYWVSVQANLSSAFDLTSGTLTNVWTWGTIEPQELNPAVFRNPPNGLNTGASTWTPTQDVVFFTPINPDQSFRLLGVRAVRPPCLHPNTEVMTVDGIKPISQIKAGDQVIDYKGQPVEVVYNMLFTPKTNVFVSIPANSLGKNFPQKDILIRKSHPILYRGKEVDPLRLAKKLRKRHWVKEIKIEDKVEVWSLCTKNRTFVMMQGVPVATWEQKDWEENASKKMGVAWSKQ